MKRIYPYDSFRDHRRVWSSIVVEQPLNEFAKDFGAFGGEAIRHNPRTQIMPEYESLPVDAPFERDRKVPLIFMNCGMARFSSVSWSHHNTATDMTEFYGFTDRSIGRPCLIPASYIEIECDPTQKAGNAGHIRIRLANKLNVYWGAAFWVDRYSNLTGVTPLVCEAGYDIAPHSAWQPLIIPIGRAPSLQNFEFISRRDAGALLVPSPRGHLSIEAVPSHHAHRAVA